MIDACLARWGRFVAPFVVLSAPRATLHPARPPWRPRKLAAARRVLQRVSPLALALALALGMATRPAVAAPPACPFAPDQLGKALGISFEAGKDEPGMGGTSCKYMSKGAGDPITVFVLVLPPGSSQDMMRTMIAGGPKAKFEPIAGDPDAAARVRAADGSLIDVTYRRAGHVVFLRASPSAFEPDAAKREARAAGMVKKLLSLPRLP